MQRASIGQVEELHPAKQTSTICWGGPAATCRKQNWVDARIKDQVPGFDVADGGSVEVFTNLGDAKSRLNLLGEYWKGRACADERVRLLSWAGRAPRFETLIPSEAAGIQEGDRRGS